MNHLFLLIVAIKSYTVCVVFFSSQCRFVKIWPAELPVCSLSVFMQLWYSYQARRHTQRRTRTQAHGARCRLSVFLLFPAQLSPPLSLDHII